MSNGKIVNHKIVNGVSTEWKGEHTRFLSNPGPKKYLSNDIINLFKDHVNFDKEVKFTQNEIYMILKDRMDGYKNQLSCSPCLRTTYFRTTNKFSKENEIIHITVGRKNKSK